MDFSWLKRIFFKPSQYDSKAADESVGFLQQMTYVMIYTAENRLGLIFDETMIIW